MSSKREQQRLLDIIENIEAIPGYVAGMTFEAYVSDRKTVDAVERCIQRITEAMIKIGSDRMAQIEPGIALKEVSGLGNILRHAYDVVDPRIIWSMTEEQFPALLSACRNAVLRG
jgi:uncharacterized protein with HEPN domain